MIDHIAIAVSDPGRAVQFYEAPLFDIIGYEYVDPERRHD